MSFEPWEPVIPQRSGFWQRQFELVPTRAQDRFDALFGVIVPVLCFMADPIIFQSRIGEPPWLEHYQLIAYVVSTIEMGLFLVWRTFRKQVNGLSPLFAGVFFGGAAFSAVIGVAILPVTIIGLVFFLVGIFGFVPFVTAFVYLRSASRAMRSSGLAHTQPPIN